MFLVLLVFYLIFLSLYISLFFFFNDTATTEIYTLSLHDALPISADWSPVCGDQMALYNEMLKEFHDLGAELIGISVRSEEHTSELQSQSNLVCRLLLEKKKKNITS